MHISLLCRKEPHGKVYQKVKYQDQKDLIKNINILDGIYRSYGILHYAKLMSNNECMKLLSNLRFGIEMGIFENIDANTVNRLFIEIQPATLMKNIGKKLSAAERDQIRAELVRNTLFHQKVPANRRLK